MTNKQKELKAKIVKTHAAVAEALKPFIIDEQENISEAAANTDTITLTRAEFEAVKADIVASKRKDTPDE